MKKEQQVYIAIGLGAVAFVFFYYVLLLSPINRNISEKLKKIAEVNQTLISSKKEAAALDELRAKSQQLQLEVTELQKRLPKTEDVPVLLRVLTRDAQKFGIKISNFQPHPIVPKQDYNEISYSLNITANFHSLGNFLAELGQEERLFSARDLIINSAGGGDKSLTITGTFVLVSYIGKGG